MNKYPLIGSSIIVVVLIVLGSMNNIVGYQTVQASNQNIINSEIDQKELLFQTIVNVANNKGIQRIILKSQISKEGFFNPDVRYSIFNTPVLTKNQLKHMYVVGVMLSKIISKSKMHSMLKQYQVSNPGVQKEISAIIEKDATLKAEMTQLSSLSCDCENANTTYWTFPVLCLILFPIWLFNYLLIFFSLWLFDDVPLFIQNLYVLIYDLLQLFNCSWY